VGINLRFIITLTPFVPLSLKGEGEGFKKGLAPLEPLIYE
jgi:hypothetical protein